MARVAVALLLWLAATAAYAQLPMTGAGNSAPTVAYVGPGDVKSGAKIFLSCARAYTAAYAATAANICDLVKSSDGSAVCTLKLASNGYVDQSAYCGGSTPSSACTTAGGCSISKIYDQSGNGNDFTQATVANAPTANFSSPGSGSLPAIRCNAAVCLMTSAASVSAENQPFNDSAVYQRTGATTTLDVLLADNNATGIGSASAANKVAIDATTEVQVSATDSSWHALQGTLNTTSSALMVDGSDNTGLSIGTSNRGTATWRFFRNVGNMRADIMEVGTWGGGAWNATDRTNMTNNQRSSTSGYNF